MCAINPITVSANGTCNTYFPSLAPSSSLFHNVSDNLTKLFANTTSDTPDLNSANETFNTSLSFSLFNSLLDSLTNLFYDALDRLRKDGNTTLDTPVSNSASDDLFNSTAEKAFSDSDWLGRLHVVERLINLVKEGRFCDMGTQIASKCVSDEDPYVAMPSIDLANTLVTGPCKASDELFNSAAEKAFSHSDSFPRFHVVDTLINLVKEGRFCDMGAQIASKGVSDENQYVAMHSIDLTDALKSEPCTPWYSKPLFGL